MSTHANMVKMTTATTGTGTITLGSASSGYQSFASAYGANATVDVMISDGTAWEVARDCTYTHSGTTLTRGTLEASSTGSALNLSGSATVQVVATAGFGNNIENFLGAWGALSGENSITTTATAVIGRLNVCSGTTSDYTVTLPAVSGNSGKYIGFRMDAALTKLVTLDGNASETIDGATTRVMWAGETALLYCNGTTWTKAAGKTIPMMGGYYLSTTMTGLTTAETLWSPVTSSFDNTALMVNTSTKEITVKRTAKYTINLNSVWTIGTSPTPLIYITAKEGSNYICAAYNSGGDATTNAVASAGGTFSMTAAQVFKAYLGTSVATNVEFIAGAHSTYMHITEMPEW